MEEYESSNPSGGYNVQGYVFFSSGPNFNVDVAAEDIIQPTSDFRYLRQNPICNTMNPIVVIRNNGKTPLTSCKISFWIDDQPRNEYTWTGNLNFLEKTEVTLPAWIDLGEPNTQHTFHFLVSYPNQTIDEYANNDQGSTTYTTPKSYSNKIALTLRTDESPEDNAIRWELIDGSTGAVIEEGSGYENGQLVRDTFLLATGCYRFTIYDEGLGEGLRPWIYGKDQSGNDLFKAGSYSLKDDKNAFIVNITSTSNAANFGNRNTSTFRVTGPAAVGEQKTVAEFTLYPNPAQTSVTIDLAQFGKDEVEISVYDVLGKLVLIQQAQGNTAALDIRELGEGSYIVRIESATAKASQPIVIER
jgi:hypothetical protein